MIKQNKILAVIPARAGSKRLIKKNSKLLGGVPLVGWTIEAALQSKIFSKVIVSTDCTDLANIARERGALAPFTRPDYLSTDSATSIDVMLHCIEFCEKHFEEEYESIVLLQPTSPFRTSENIKEAYSLFKTKEAASVISVCELEHPKAWSNKLTTNLRMDSFFKEKAGRSQDYEPEYRLNGAIYIVDIDYLKKNKKILSGDSTYAYQMPIDESLDIDTEYQFSLCEGLLATNYFSQ